MSDRRKPFPFDVFEPAWQQRWDTEKTYRTPGPGDADFDASKPKFYVLDMFPYPSGSGLHVGHPEGYTATDILARTRRMQGFNVLHPMGWDAFGLPAEQYAIKTGQHPRVTTEANVANFRRQLKALGFSYDWDREVDTTDPAYVRWTQWLFLRLYHSYYDAEAGKARPVADLEAKGWTKEQIDAVRLAYVAEVPVNWSPDLGTVLANEEVEEWRSKGHTVERRPLRQWMLRITAYAERLIDELDGLDWPEGIKTHQRNWIGKSEGAEVEFPVPSIGKNLTVYTTRPDTLFGATYMVLAPEHPWVDELATPEHAEAVAAYRQACSAKSDLERTELAKEKTGVFTGAHAINPVNGEQIPIWIADYVLMGYGTGAIMAVPAHDERDHEFARQFGLPIQRVVQERDALVTSPEPAAQRSKTVSVLPHGELPPYDDWENLSVTHGEQGLPHWQLDGATYAVAFRLADSIPTEAKDKLREEKELLEARARRNENVANELAALSARIQLILDQGLGSCALREPANARIVADALRHFDGSRYHLGAWCVMPNHVHVIVRPIADHSLGEILHSWKSFTSHEIQKRMGTKGEFWQKDAFNRIIRDEREWEAQSSYVVRNPQEAGLENWEWFGHGSLGSERDALTTSPESAAPRNKTVSVLPAPAPHPAGTERDAFVASAAFTGEGVAVNSGFLDGLGTEAAKAKMIDWLEAEGKGRRRVNYKLRDWLFSRQRYWGEPFPIVWENGTHRAIDDSELPLLQPEMEDFKPTGDPRGPLARATDWIRYSETAERETNTMPQWAGSCWYYLRFCDPRNPNAFLSKEAEAYWLGGNHGAVDLYVGGTEHAVLHLLYARFWHKVMFDLGYLSTPEPFQRLVNQGLILGEDGQKMSKSRGNVVNPDDIVAEFGADSLRLFEMFMGPLQDAKPWSTKGVEGSNRFLARVWRVVMEESPDGGWTVSPKISAAPCTDKKMRRLVHQTIRKVTEDIDRLAFNTAIPQLMVCNNDALMAAEVLPLEELHIFLRLLNPFAPHLTEELNARLQEAFPSLPSGQLCQQSWPIWDPAALVVDEVEIIVQVNGKLRDKLVVAPDCPKDELEARALQAPKAKPHLEGLTVRKVIVVPGKLVNIVAN